MEEPVSALMPPGGSVFDTLSGKEGPPMLRMMMIQGSFELINKIGRLNNRGKIAVVLLISLGFIVNDFNKFMR